MAPRHKLALGRRSPAARRTPTSKPLDPDEYAAKIIAAVYEDGGWTKLLPLPLDGYLLVPSRSEEYADHHVQLEGRNVLYCTGPCQGHVTCFHRVAAALACWQAEHEGWDISAVVNPDTGKLQSGLVHRLIDAYLTPPRRPFVRWWLSPDVAAACPEERGPEAKPLRQFTDRHLEPTTGSA